MESYLNLMYMDLMWIWAWHEFQIEFDIDLI